MGWQTGYAAQERRREVLAEAQAALGAAVEPFHRLGKPALTWSQSGRPACLAYQEHEDFAETVIEVSQLGAPDFRLVVAPEGVIAKTLKFLGGEDIQVGDEVFDRRFRITSSNRELALDLLSPAVRALVAGVLDFSGFNSGGFRIEKSSLTVRTPRLLETRAALTEFLQLGTHLVDAYTAVLVTWCRVCAHRIDGASTSCPNCSARYHAACWELVQGCEACSRRAATR